jgi:uncharacterized protein YsxB (DUF464 family)
MSEAILVGVLCAAVSVLAIVTASPFSLVTGVAFALLSGGAGYTMMRIGAQDL